MQDKTEIVQLLVRMFTGIIFLFQGYDKLLRLRIPKVVDTYLADAAHLHIHRPFLTVFTSFTSVAEFVGGAALILGLGTNYALYLLGIDLVLVAVAFSMLQPIWDMRHVFPRLILVCALLLMPAEWNTYSMDQLLNLL